VDDQLELRDAIRQATDPLPVMDRITRQAVELTDGAEGAAVELLAADGGLVYVSVAGMLAGHENVRLAVDASFSGLAVRERRTLVCDDAELDRRVDREACRLLGIRSMICVPLVHQDVAFGVLKVCSSHPGTFGGHQQATLNRLAHFVSAVIGTALDLSGITRALLGERPVTTGSGSLSSGRTPDTDPHSGDEAGGSAADGSTSAVEQFVSGVLAVSAVHDRSARRRIEHALRQPLAIVVQPVFDLVTGEVIAAEALARFDSAPHRPPDAWFAEAHAVGLGIELELHAVNAALALLAHLPERVRLGVNVGPAAATDQRLTDAVLATDADRVVLELTEHVRVDDYPALVEGIDALRRAGTALAIDDTGAGFASLRHILRLSPDVIKLDRELTSGIDHDPVRRALANALVSFAADIGATIVAEGIETDRELHTLRSLGIRNGQGFYLGRPGPADALAGTRAPIGVG